MLIQKVFLSWEERAEKKKKEKKEKKRKKNHANKKPMGKTGIEGCALGPCLGFGRD